MISQKDGVFQAITSELETNEFEQGLDFKTISKESKENIYQAVTEGLANGDVTFSETAQAKHNTPEKIRKDYVPGLVNNWVRKDERLNGGVKYQAKNPGSRAGSQDPEIKAMKILIQNYESGSTEYEALASRIATKLETIRAEKAKSKAQEVDLSVIPDDLKELLGL